MNILRRLPLSRLLLLCALVLLIGVSATALAFALTAGPKPPAKPLAQAVHDTLAAANSHTIEGLSANITLTNHLLEGASLASGNGGGGLTSSPLIAGGSGRLWVAKDGHIRLELQAEKGDTQLIYDGHTVTIYDAASNTLYHYTPPASEDNQAPPTDTGAQHEVPSVAKVEEAISHIEAHATLSSATPDNIASQPAYTVRVSPKEGGSLLGGAELSFDAENGLPLRAAIYSSTSPTPIIELAATEVSFGPVPSSIFQLTPPAGVKVEELTLPKHDTQSAPTHTGASTEKPTLTTHGHGLSSIAVLEDKTKGSSQGGEALEGLPKVSINGASASELRTELGTILTFERSGVRYVLAGSVTPSAIEALAKGL